MTLLNYFNLQFILLKRQLIDFGLQPWLGFLIVLITFYGFSIYLFTTTTFANYIYAILATGLVFKHNEIKKNNFLKFTFTISFYYKIRLLENLITIAPFILFLCIYKAFYSALIVLFISMVLIFYNNGKQFSLTIPTPFYKKPFEFIVGFRSWFLIFALSYFLTAMSVIYQNFNLGIFSLILAFLVCFSFYNEPESEFYVWVHKLSVNKFLFDKIKTAILFSTLITLPITLVMLYFFKQNIHAIIGFQLLGYCYLVTIILAKYSTYPQKMNLPQGVLFAISIAIPPFLLGLIPFFYMQSAKRLKDILE